MKKVLLSVLALAMVTMFAACTKDGVFNPSKKISRVYESSGSSARHLTELWHWDGKKLSSIDYYTSSGALSYIYNFSYDGNQLTRVDCYAANYYIEFSYDAGRIKKFSTYSNGSLYLTGEAGYSNKKLSKMVLTYYSKKGTAEETPELAQVNANMLDLIIPCFDKEEYIKNVATKAVGSAVYNFTWNGSNISEQVFTSGSSRTTRKYTYDKKNNPYYGSLMAFYDEGPSVWGSKNNIVSQIVTVQDNTGMDNTDFHYSYTYDGNWPTIQNITYTGGSNAYATYWDYE